MQPDLDAGGTVILDCQLLSSIAPIPYTNQREVRRYDEFGVFGTTLPENIGVFHSISLKWRGYLSRIV